ncbi:DUF4649 family protein [Streptococcus sp. DD13]|uniref:DUF4649 family protein n=1 Tax=Streptococcus sp. DD13 TaxID=1777881 RepID=UPI00079B2014|nr:DUF4649 family protein [Streptococcus sp. DD13]KXT78682.1 hypothetical protein STRDD13_00508 [Streptococcus sp. DD13]
MYELQYQDNYKVNRVVRYHDLDEMLLAFSGCVTLPDNLPVQSLTLDGKNLGYHGLIGDLYPFLKSIDPKSK